jgi:hypothetical protein
MADELRKAAGGVSHESLIELAAVAVGTPFARRIVEVARSSVPSRSGVTSAGTELGLDSEAQLREGVDLLVEAIRRAILDHRLQPSELEEVRTLQRLLGIQEGDALRLRREDVADLVRETMEVVLSDSLVTGAEADYKVGLQEAFGLSYDEFLGLAREQHDAALRALLAKVDPDGGTLTDEQFREFHLRAVHLDSVLHIDLLKGDRDGSPGRYIPGDVKNAVWRRDGGRCATCGSAEHLEFDHIVPHSRGGSSTYRNVQLLCERCNRRKGATLG